MVTARAGTNATIYRAVAGTGDAGTENCVLEHGAIETRFRSNTQTRIVNVACWTAKFPKMAVSALHDKPMTGTSIAGTSAARAEARRRP